MLIRNFYSNHREIISYIFFGILTVVVNFVSFGLILLSLSIFKEIQNDLRILIANTMAWIVAVLFAFFTNKRYVFQSKTSGRLTLIKEITSFISTRLITFGIETGMIYIGLRAYVWFAISISNNLWTWCIKLVTGFVIIILNFYFSKFIFKKKDSCIQE